VLSLTFLQCAEAQSAGILAEFSALPVAAQNDINQLCLPLQYRDGAEAFRGCVNDEISKLKTDGTLLLENYPFDEKYAVQQACAASRQNSENHLACIKDQIQKLDGVAVPDLSELNDEERKSIQNVCTETQKSAGAAAYRRCSSEAAQEILKIPRTDLSQFSNATRESIKANCANPVDTSVTTNYRLCLAQALAEVLKQERDQRAAQNQSAESTASVVVASNQSDEATGDALATLPSQESDRDNSADAGTPADTIAASDDDKSASVTATEPTSEANNAAQPEQSYDDQLAGRTPMGNYQSPFAMLRENPKKFFSEIATHDASYYAKLLLPLLVIFIGISAIRFLFSRRRAAAAPTPNYQQQAAGFSDDQFHDSLLNDPSFTTANGLASDDFDIHPFDRADPDTPAVAPKKPRDAFDEPGEYQLDVSATTRFYRPEEPVAASAPVSVQSPSAPDPYAEPQVPVAEPRYRAAPEIHEAYAEPPAQLQPEQSQPVHGHGQKPPETTLLDRTLTTPTYSESDFGKWLREQPIQDHKRLCTEFMLYWVSFGDGQYDPQLKQHLMRAVELNEHDLIKKWVLEENPSSLVDMLQRIWSLFSKEEIEQTISLMLALLVKKEISPIQNTFFRFLADFAHIGSEGLQHLYYEAFEQKLPPLPRPDDERWWSHQSRRATEVSVETSAEPAQEKTDFQICLSMLGLSEPTSSQEIELAYARLARRCDPARFHLLGERERGLVQRHLEKYTHAYEYLTETA